MRRRTQDLLVGTLFCGLSGLVLHRLVRDADKRPPLSAHQTSYAFPAAADSALKVASYDLDATLDTAAHEISARETIHFVNRSTGTLNELWFHLYLNAFKNDKTLFLRSPFGAGRSGEKAHQYGYVDVKKLVWVEADRKDLWPN